MNSRDTILSEVIAALTEADGIGSWQEAVEVVEGLRTATGPKQPLTARQREVYDFIVEFRAHQRVSPSTREIQQVFKFASQTAAMQFLRTLQEKGWISLTPRIARSAIPL